ncbi:MAG: InlB B-repeat-containing protein [Coriobacteriia bacterium]|nr:InlB B-repeat-containing protein [Coriobacteriia bacterium]
MLATLFLTPLAGYLAVYAEDEVIEGGVLSEAGQIEELQAEAEELEAEELEAEELQAAELQAAELQEEESATEPEQEGEGLAEEQEEDAAVLIQTEPDADEDESEADPSDPESLKGLDATDPDALEVVATQAALNSPTGAQANTPGALTEIFPLADPADTWVTITFVVNGNEDKRLIEKGELISPFIPEKSLWPAGANSFRGWFETGAIEPYDFTVPADTDLTLTARFSTQYLIKYLDAPGGKVTFTRELSAGSSVAASSEAIAQAVPPAGTFLDYWYEESEGPTIPFTFGTRTADKDMVLVPHFNNQLYVAFISEGSPVTSDVVALGSTITQPTDPTRAGYTFVHWSTEPDGATAFDFTAPVTAATTTSEVLALYAVWTPATTQYTVVYWYEKPNFTGDPGYDPLNYSFYKSEIVTNVATGSVADYSTETSSTLTGIYVSGYRWTNSVADYHHGESKVVEGDGTTVINVYYSRTVFTYIFNLDPRSGYYSEMTFPRTGGTTYSQGEGVIIPTFYSFTAKYEQDIEDLWPSNWNADFYNDDPDRLYFHGWQGTNSNLTSRSTKGLTATEEFIPEGPGTQMVLRASANSVSIPKFVYYWFEALPDDPLDKIEPRPIGFEQYTFFTGIPADGFVLNEKDSQILISSSTAVNAKVFSGMESCGQYLINDDLPNGEFNFYYMRVRSELSFNTMGGIEGARAPGKDYTDIMFEELLKDYLPANPTKTLDGITYTFVGWYLEPDYYTPVDFGSTRMPAYDFELYARWQGPSQTVKFYDGVGGSDLSKDQSVEIGKLAVAPTDYEPGVTFDSAKGYFEGWFYYLDPASSHGFTRYNFGIPVTEDIDLYATWKTTGFIVTYDPGLGSGTVPVDPHPGGYDFNAQARALDGGSGLVAPVNQYFYGWRISGDATNTLYWPDDLFVITGDTTLVAQFSTTNFFTVISYRANGGTGTMADQPARFGQSLTLTPNAFVRPGYTFSGWNTVASGSGGTAYSDGQSFTPWQLNTDVILYAQWTLVPPTNYTVTVNGSYAATTGAGSYTAGTAVTVNAGARAGYNFSGWTVQAGAISLANTASAGFTMPASNVTVTANWTLIPVTVVTYSVTYAPGDHGTFTAQTTAGLALGAATPAAPATPGDTGWSFAGWSPAQAATVTGDVTYTAQWNEVNPPTPPTTFTVRFVDWNGNLLKSEEVDRGGNATAPSNPTRAAYTFDRWDRSYTNITANITVTALYVPNSIETLVPDGVPLGGGLIELLRQEGVPIFTIFGQEVPLHGGSHNNMVWALVNLILAILGVILAIIWAIRALLLRKRDEDEDEDEQAGAYAYKEMSYAQRTEEEEGKKKKIRPLWLVLALVMGVLGIVFFFITEDMRNLMVLVDNWTIVNAIIFVLEIVGMVFAFKKADKDDEQQEAAFESMGVEAA